MKLVRLLGFNLGSIFIALIVSTVVIAGEVKWVAVAHAVSAGTDLPRALRAQAELANIEIKLLHLKLGNFDSDLVSTYRGTDFDAELEFPQGTEVATVLAALQPYHLEFPIVVASEGPDWPFYINERLGLPTLAGDKAHALLNKNLFYAYLRNHDFAISRQALDFIELRSSAEAVRLAEQGRFSFPVAVKPSNSAAGHGFKIVQNTNELVEHVRFLLESNWLLLDGRRIETVVVQPSFQGNHYSLQITAVNNNFVVSDIFQHIKQDSIYLQSELQNPESEFTRRLFASQIPLLRSLGGTFTVHLEVVDDPRFGFVPYDCGPRPMGGKEHRLVKSVLGANQQDRLAMAIIRPRDFIELAQANLRSRSLYGRSSFAVLVDWRQMSAGVALSDPRIDFVKSLPGYIDHVTRIEAGTRLSVTDSLVNSYGATWFSGEEKVVRNSIASLRALESQGVLVPLSKEESCGEQF